MRFTVWLLLLLCFAFLLSAFAFLSCEETLEICPACGEIADGDAEIIKDPRIDNTFTAVQSLRTETIRMSQRADKSLDSLLKVFAAAPNGGETKIAALQRAVHDFTSASAEPPFNATITFSACGVDRIGADRAQNICEESLCNINRPGASGLCRGISAGSCINPVDGLCFQSSPGFCPGECTGTCNNISVATCPGDCFGTCDGRCFSYNSQGACAGGCDGNCTGICVSPLPFTCGGQCEGACGENTVDGECDDTDTFVGSCDEPSENSLCRGQYYPEGCGAKCPGCVETAGDCRESAKFLAWSWMDCSDAAVLVTPHLSGDDSDAMVIQKTNALKENLAPIADDLSRLSLLLDGIDLRTNKYLGDAFKKGENGSLDDAADQYYDYTSLEQSDLPPVDLDRAYLPIEALKARIYWLLRVSLNSSGGFNVSAGNFDCLEPALNDAASLLRTMVPVIRKENENGTTYSADMDCTPEEMPLDDAVPCLYNLLKLQTELLALLDLDSPQ